MSFNQMPPVIEKYHEIRTSASILGVPIPILFGQDRLTSKLVWYGNLQIRHAQQQGGKGLLKGGTNYVYTASIVAFLAEGPLSYLLSVWDGVGKFVVDTTTELVQLPLGGGTYTVNNASIYANDQGAAKQAAYTSNPNDYGAPPGSGNASGTQNIPLTRVSSSPGPGQYSVDETTGIYTFNAAEQNEFIVIGYSFYRYRLIVEQTAVIPSSPPYEIIVDQQATFIADDGVIYFPTTPTIGGNAFVKDSHTIGAGHYDENDGTYNFNSADAGQPVVISYEYKDPNQDTNAPNTINILLVDGALGQPPLTYMTSKNQYAALGYSNVGYIFSSGMYMGYTNELPNYSYEIAGPARFGAAINDCDPAQVIKNLLTNPQYGVGLPTYLLGDLTLASSNWVANSFFISLLLENSTSCSSVIGQILEAGMTAAFFSEGVVKFVPYCDTTAVGNGVTYSPPTNPIYAITIDDIVGESTGDPIELTRSDWEDANNRVAIVYRSRANDYNPEVIQEDDPGSILRYGQLLAEDPVQYDFIKILSAAQYAASQRLQRKVQIRNRYTIAKLTSALAFLEPMDIVTIPNPTNPAGPSVLPVRVTKVEDDPVAGLTVEFEDFIWGLAAPAYNPKTATSPPPPNASQADPGPTTGWIFEAPDSGLSKQDGNVLFGFVRGNNSNWGGCHVWVSVDGSSYELLPTGNVNTGAVTIPARIGTLVNNVASFSFANNPDTINTIKVKMNSPDDELPSASALQAQKYATRSILVDNTNPQSIELFSYQNAALIGSAEYALTTLYRGIYGTPGGSHTAGALFARLDQASFEYRYLPELYGATISFKFTSFNLYGQAEESLADVTPYTWTLQGVGPGAVDLTSGVTRNGLGSIPNSLSGNFTYAATSTSIIWYWDGTHSSSPIVVTRGTMPNPGGDANTTQTFTGSQSCTSLTASTTYGFFPFVNDAVLATVIVFVTNAEISGGTGAPAIAYTSLPNDQASLYQGRNDHLAMSTAPMVAATTSGGTGGGSGGGTGGTCPHASMRVCEMHRGNIAVAQLKVGDMIRGRGGWRKVLRVSVKKRPLWVRVTTSSGEKILVTPNHLWPTQDGNKQTCELTIEDVLFGVDGREFVNAIEVVRSEGDCVDLTVDGDNLYYIGSQEPRILTHNNIIYRS